MEHEGGSTLAKSMERHPTPACKAAHASKAVQARIAGLTHNRLSSCTCRKQQNPVVYSIATMQPSTQLLRDVLQYCSSD
jgi:hypothetical protein